MSKRLYIQDVATRDGFQIEPNFIPTEDKIALIDRLSETGLAKIEVTSFTSPKAIPNLRDAEEVMRGIRRVPGVEYTVLVPNVKGCERALACGVDEINLVMSASDTHGMANLRMTPEQSLVQFREIIEATRSSGVFVNASLSTTFGCPFEGEVPERRVHELVQRLLEIGVQGITLCDTTGMADPAQVERICHEAIARWPEAVFTAHFHNTRGMGLANALAALNAGIDRFDASLGGLGGCPYAPGASGNICTEDLVHMFQRMGMDTGVDLDKLLECAARLPELVGHDVPGAVLKAGKSDRRYPKPKWMQADPTQ
ncbi:hydroxymethylglutaryl-CoA lyase [Stutzerimonas stutzeri]|uniref:Hydroxymethylglutaryl-CoA lyase n=1 Tax=Stutzerimonas stutzeri TaxID=316 RepID=A0A6I6LQB1_STUST|nr:hydroxymethylglutaryl-CoA lyase [Stutzerimonas stutzeri]QGZ30566.1 hydroxymethylglutaryl-CoA lyase [Stutzerimonas stutzeri]